MASSFWAGAQKALQAGPPARQPSTKSQQPKQKPGWVNTLEVFAIAIGVGMFGAYMLDMHSHTCQACGNRWRHLGAFNFGEVKAHTCAKCGTVEWWKCGYQGAFVPVSKPSPFGARPASPPPTSPMPVPQEIREVRPAELPSETPAALPPLAIARR